MIALLIHFLGFLIVNSAVPPYIGSADAYFLAWWYAAFAAVDLLALCFASGRIRVVLAASFAWSGTLVIEAASLNDSLQRCDWYVQIAIDCVLIVMLVSMLSRARSK